MYGTWKPGMYIWRRGHSESEQRILLVPEVAEVIAGCLQLCIGNLIGGFPLFVGTGSCSGSWCILTTTISTMLKQMMQAANLHSERLTTHSLLCTADTAAMEVTGDNFSQVQTYMRHADPKITELYTRWKREEIQAEVACRIYNLYHSETGSVSPKKSGTTAGQANTFTD